MNKDGLFDRAINHVLYASGVGQNILRHSHNAIFPTTGYVLPDLNSVYRVIQKGEFTNDIQFFILMG